MSTDRTCWVCGATCLTRVRESTLNGAPSESDFRITSSDYGRTGAIDRCDVCGFFQCSDMTDVLGHYEAMVDPEYEATREQRAIQERALLRKVSEQNLIGRRLLDVGAGSGILVEQARLMEFDAQGVEPSQALQARAAQLGLPVALGVLPHPDVTGKFDVVTLVDVIEHVPTPVDLLQQVCASLADNGLLVVVTPDRKSLAATLLGYRWWHYRIGHIGYFDRNTLTRALDRAGLEPIATFRPTWYFPLPYLVERIGRYLPKALRPSCPSFAANWLAPLNLRDSLAMICRKAPHAP